MKEYIRYILFIFFVVGSSFATHATCKKTGQPKYLAVTVPANNTADKQGQPVGEMQQCNTGFTLSLPQQPYGAASVAIIVITIHNIYATVFFSQHISNPPFAPPQYLV